MHPIRAGFPHPMAGLRRRPVAWCRQSPACRRKRSASPTRRRNRQIEVAIPKLERRAQELKEIDVNALRNPDDVLPGMLSKIEDTLVEVFGTNTIEFNRYYVGKLDDTPVNLAGGAVPIDQRRSYIQSGIQSAISRLETAISILKEHLQDNGVSSAVLALKAYERLSLQPEIAKAASALYMDGHYSNAVEAAVKALNNLVRLKSGLVLDGTTLM